MKLLRHIAALYICIVYRLPSTRVIGSRTQHLALRIQCNTVLVVVDCLCVQSLLHIDDISEREIFVGFMLLLFFSLFLLCRRRRLNLIAY